MALIIGASLNIIDIVNMTYDDLILNNILVSALYRSIQGNNYEIVKKLLSKEKY